ncbi:MAG: hypothetical protein AAFY55_18650, partial [Bacteroidota bacterium]
MRVKPPALVVALCALTLLVGCGEKMPPRPTSYRVQADVRAGTEVATVSETEPNRPRRTSMGRTITRYEVAGDIETIPRGSYVTVYGSKRSEYAPWKSSRDNMRDHMRVYLGAVYRLDASGRVADVRWRFFEIPPARMRYKSTAALSRVGSMRDLPRPERPRTGGGRNVETPVGTYWLRWDEANDLPAPLPTGRYDRWLRDHPHSFNGALLHFNNSVFHALLYFLVPGLLFVGLMYYLDPRYVRRAMWIAGGVVLVAVPLFWVAGSVARDYTHYVDKVRLVTEMVHATRGTGGAISEAALVDFAGDYRLYQGRNPATATAWAYWLIQALWLVILSPLFILVYRTVFFLDSGEVDRAIRPDVQPGQVRQSVVVHEPHEEEHGTVNEDKEWAQNDKP